jgi:hypothetical protein
MVNDRNQLEFLLSLPLELAHDTVREFTYCSLPNSSLALTRLINSKPFKSLLSFSACSPLRDSEGTLVDFQGCLLSSLTSAEVVFERLWARRNERIKR